MDVHGAMVSEVQLAAGVTSMAWSAEKFTMEEGDDDLTNDRSHKGRAIFCKKWRVYYTILLASHVRNVALKRAIICYLNVCVHI